MRNFSYSEFDSPDKEGSGKNMSKEFLRALDSARDLAGIPFKINSGFRTKARNLKVGGVSGSAHCKGLAVDISAKDSRSRFIILEALILTGFTRIGIAKTFIHVDMDEAKSQEVTWLY